MVRILGKELCTCVVVYLMSELVAQTTLLMLCHTFPPIWDIFVDSDFVWCPLFYVYVSSRRVRHFLSLVVLVVPSS